MKFDFIARRYWWFALSALIMIFSIISMAVQGFNLGIDFTGGTLLDLKFAQPVTVSQVRDALKDYHLEGSTIQLAAGTKTEISQNVFIRTHVLTEDERAAALQGLKQKVGDFEVLRIEKVGAVIGSELTSRLSSLWSCPGC
jgi:preprotein translocase subunit SecF